jgi:hypothetical protein
MCSLLSEVMLVIGFVIIVVGLCIPGPPFSPDLSDRLAMLALSFGVMAVGGLIMWLSTRLEDDTDDSVQIH